MSNANNRGGLFDLSTLFGLAFTALQFRATYPGLPGHAVGFLVLASAHILHSAEELSR